MTERDGRASVLNHFDQAWKGAEEGRRRGLSGLMLLETFDNELVMLVFGWRDPISTPLGPGKLVKLYWPFGSPMPRIIEISVKDGEKASLPDEVGVLLKKSTQLQAFGNVII